MSTRERIAEEVRSIAEAYTDQMPPDDDELDPYTDRLAALLDTEGEKPDSHRMCECNAWMSVGHCREHNLMLWVH